MTLSPEERAREIAQSILLSPFRIPFLGTVTAEKIIAAALRAAENEALERAAAKADEYGIGYSAQIATAIRALKTTTS